MFCLFCTLILYFIEKFHKNISFNYLHYILGTLVKWSITFYGTENLPDCVRNNTCMQEEKTEEKQTFQVRGVTVSTLVNVVSIQM